MLYASLAEHEDHSRYDQVGALCFCAPVCFMWRTARGSWIALSTPVVLDRDLHGQRAVSGYGI